MEHEHEEAIESLRRALPPIFLGARIGELTGGALCWGTLQNRRSRREIPGEGEIFLRSGNRVLVRRDPLLAWWSTTLSAARRPPVLPPPRRSQRAPVTTAPDRAGR